MTPRILFLVPADYGELEKKGVAFMLAEKEENGFFERVVTVHPTAGQNRVVDISPVQRLYEFREFFLPFGKKSKAFRYAHHLFHLLRLLWSISGIVRREKINLIRATDPQLPGLLAWFLSMFFNLPFCISLHADYDKRYDLDPLSVPTLFGSRAVAKRFEKFLFKKADLVMPIRVSLARKLEKSGVPAESLRVIPHGVNLSPFRKGPDPRIGTIRGVPEKANVLSFVGRLTKENYVYDVLRLATELHRKRSDFVVVMAGDGPEREGMVRYIAEHGLGPVVVLAGFQPREAAINLRMKCVVSLCLMGGYSLIEACAAGRPVIAYDVEWHSELVVHGRTGFLVPEGNLEKLLDCTESLLNDPAMADRFGSAARALAFERHDIERTSEIKKACYRELLQRAPRNA